MGDLDIAIAGCGIAGLAAALLLHRAGHRVALYERFEQPRPLGSGLMIQPTGLAVLAELGLAEEVVARGARISRLYGKNAEGSVVLDACYADFATEGVFGLGIHRASLFGALYRAVEAGGIPMHPGREIVGSDASRNGRRLRFTGGEVSPAYDLIVDALGVSSALAPTTSGWLPYGALWTTLRWPSDGPFRTDWLEQRYERAHRMIGVLPTGTRDGHFELALFWSIRGDEYSDWQRLGLGSWKDEVRALWPECADLLEQIDDPAKMTFARYSHRTSTPAASERLIHIGDSWHSASPQLGQGANMALLDAWALARALAREGAARRPAGTRGLAAALPCRLVPAADGALHAALSKRPAAARGSARCLLRAARAHRARAADTGGAGRRSCGRSLAEAGTGDAGLRRFR